MAQTSRVFGSIIEFCIMKHEFETTRLALAIQICAFQITINNTQIKGKIHDNLIWLVALSGQFLCV